MRMSCNEHKLSQMIRKGEGIVNNLCEWYILAWLLWYRTIIWVWIVQRITSIQVPFLTQSVLNNGYIFRLPTYTSGHLIFPADRWWFITNFYYLQHWFCWWLLWWPMSWMRARSYLSQYYLTIINCFSSIIVLSKGILFCRLNEILLQSKFVTQTGPRWKPRSFMYEQRSDIKKWNTKRINKKSVGMAADSVLGLVRNSVLKRNCHYRKSDQY